MAEIKLREGKYTFQLLEKITPRTQNEPPYQRKLQLSDRSLVVDPATGKHRFLRYIPGAGSRWLDEQEKIDPSYASANAWRPEFNTGTLILEYPQDAEKLEVLMMRDEYDGKENRIAKTPPMYTLVNKEQEYENKLDFAQERHKAESIALQADFEEIKSHASFLNIALTENGRERSEKEVRGDYWEKATTNPKLFLKTYDSPVANLAGAIKEAIKQGFIDLTHVKNQACYAETKKLICVLDPKKEAYESLVEFAMSKDGADFRKRVSTLGKK